MKTSLFVAFSSLATLPCTCSIQLTKLEVPAQVQTGSVFDVTVHGLGQYVGCSAGLSVSVVLQIPNGFQVLASRSEYERDNPNILALFTAEPGHYLAGFTGGIGSGHAGGVDDWGRSFSFDVVAPSGPTTGTFKATIVSDYTPVSGPHAASVQVGPSAGRFARVDVSYPLPTPTSAATSVWTAIGDFDGDGMDDTIHAVEDPASQTASLVAQLSSGSVVTTPATVGQLVAGDFDGDGLLDVAQAGGAVYYGDGAGAFSAGPRAPAGQLAAGDLDRDGRCDLVSTERGTVRAIRSTGRGFEAWGQGLPQLSVNWLPQASSPPAIGDVTGDGFADLVTIEPDSIITRTWVRVYAGDGRGNWTTQPRLRETAKFATVVDLDGDGRREVLYIPFDYGSLRPVGGGTPIVATMASAGPGAGQWIETTLGLPQMYALDLESVDVDRDGRADLLVHDAHGYPTLWNGLRLFLQDSAGGFQEVTDLEATLRGGRQIQVGDFDGDTWPDLTDERADVLWLNQWGGAAAFGAGCAAGGLQPRLAVRGAPVRGNQGFGLQLRGLPPGSFGLVWVGESRLQSAVGLPHLPLDLTRAGAPGCAILADPLLVRWIAADALGVGTMPLPIPNAAAWERFGFFAQGAALVPGANRLGIATTGGLAIQVE